MKKLTDSPSGMDAPAGAWDGGPSRRWRAAAQALRRAGRLSVRDGHGYEADRVTAELTIIAERRSAFDHFTR